MQIHLPIRFLRVIFRRKFVCGVICIACCATLALNSYVFKTNSGSKVPEEVKSNLRDFPGFSNASNTLCLRNSTARSLTYALYSKNTNLEHFRHVMAVFTKLGYERVDISCDWDVLWAHDYPFIETFSYLKNLKPYQKVNHFPGSGCIANKLELSASGLNYVPRSFRIPEESTLLLQYARRNPEMTFVQKGNEHRGVVIKNIKDIDFKAGGTFVQEFLSKTLLIDGHRFVIGVYTILTSINPLRVYMYNGDVLFRFCPEKFYPFDPHILGKYVCGNDYMPIWEVPSLKSLYNEQGYSMKDSFNSFLKTQGMNSSTVWDNVNKVISNIFLNKEQELRKSISSYSSSVNFFEMVRMDLVVMEDLSVYLIEVNMSPNLSSIHFPPNQLLYEQIIFNIFSLVGIFPPTNSYLSQNRPDSENMVVAMKNLLVFPELCTGPMCKACKSTDCDLCKRCIKNSTIEFLKSSYKEHVNRIDCRRIFPSLDSATPDPKNHFSDYSEENRLISKWFLGKCLLDRSWCT